MTTRPPCPPELADLYGHGRRPRGSTHPDRLDHLDLDGPQLSVVLVSTLSISGTATCTISGVEVGSYGATASYGSDGNYAGASGSDTTATVGPAVLTITSLERLVHLRRDAPEYHSELFRLRERRLVRGPHHPAVVLHPGGELEPRLGLALSVLVLGGK